MPKTRNPTRRHRKKSPKRKRKIGGISDQIQHNPNLNPNFNPEPPPIFIDIAPQGIQRPIAIRAQPIAQPIENSFCSIL